MYITYTGLETGDVMWPKSVTDMQCIYLSQLSARIAELANYVACGAKGATAKGQEEGRSTGYQIVYVYIVYKLICSYINATILRMYCIYCPCDNHQNLLHQSPNKINISIAKIGDIVTNLHPCFCYSFFITTMINHAGQGRSKMECCISCGSLFKKKLYILVREVKTIQ